MSNSKLFSFDYKFLIAIFALLSVFLFSRFYKITSIPPSLYWDEASIGYNAYSVANTFRDEWGEFLPLHFRAFGEFKLPVYIYSVAIFTKLFGLNELSVRAPAVLYSLATIIIVGLIVFEFFKNKWLSVLSLMFLIISPWFFIFSRTGYEVSAGVFFFALSFYLFQLSLKKSFYFILSAASLIITLYSYNSFRLISPITFILYCLGFFFLTKFSKKIKLSYFIIGILLMLLSALPIYKLISLDFGLARYSAVKVSNFGEIIKNYFSHFSFDFLVFRGDVNPRSNASGLGQIWFLDIPIFLCGIIYVIKKKNYLFWLPVLIFFVSFLPAAITKESPHALRSLNAIIFLDIVWIFGAKFLLDFKGYAKYVLLVVFLINFIFSVSQIKTFFTSYSNQYSEEWQFGYQQIFGKYSAQISTSNKVIISDEYAQPYIFALYYLKINSLKFRESVVYNPVDKWGISTVKSFDKFEFRKPTLNDIKSGNLVFAAPDELDSKLKVDGVINFLDEKIAFEVYKR